MRRTTLTHQFVEFIPDRLEEGILYISEKYEVMIHKCCCGCGEEVVTPLTPVDWNIRKEGNTISVFPSIGNWNFPCLSHYWIRKNQVEWATTFTKQQILYVQQRDKQDKEQYIAQINAQKTGTQKFWLFRLWYALKKWWSR